MSILKRIPVIQRLAVATGLTCALIACGGGGAGDAPVLPPAWQGVQSLELSQEEAEKPDVAINAAGVGFAVWEQEVGGANEVFSRRYRDGVWEPAQLVTGDVDTGAFDPQVVVLPDGEALVVWQHGLTGALSVASKRSVNGAWTSGPVALQENLSDVGDLELVANGNGHAAALWSRRVNVGAASVIQGAVYRNNAFEPSEAISGGVTNALSPDIAIDANGNVLAVWQQLIGGKTTVLVRPYANGDWVVERTLNDGDAAEDAQVAVGLDGLAFVAFLDKASDRIAFARATDFATNSWFNIGDGQPISAVNQKASRPQVVLDGKERATFVWNGLDGGVEKLYSSRVEVRRTGAGTVTTDELDLGLVDTQDAGSANLHQMAIDASGSVIAVWQQDDETGRSRLMSNRLAPNATQWGTLERIESESSGDANLASLAMSPDGRAVVVWEQRDGARQDILANVFK